MSRAVILWIPLIVIALPVAAEEPETLAEALRGGSPVLSLRYRYENVSDDAFGDQEARASTLRTVVGYESAPYNGLSFFIEAENVTVVGNDLYNNRGAGALSNGVTDRPVVADPALTELNQAFLRYEQGPNRLQLGRQEILRGDHRFIGNVGWRQDHQSFDALTFENRSIGRTTIHYAFVDRVHRIFGDSQGMASHLLDVTIDRGKVGKVMLYAYLLDYEDPAASRLSTFTPGAELAGQRQLAGGRWLHWELEHAQQRDAGDNLANLDPGYWHVMVGAGTGKVTAKLGLEVLESSAGGPFQTPLATLHKFNGWADRFLTIPANGLEDLYLSVGGSAGSLDWLIIAHDFSAESAGSDYGQELDAQLLYRTPWKQVIGLKAALYDADNFGTDTDKWMLWTSYTL